VVVSTSRHALRCTFLYVLSQRGLTPAQLEQFRQDGILAIPGWLDAPTVESLKAACNKLLDDFSPESVPRSIFSTEEQSRTSDRYFLESGDKVSYFYEQKAFSTDGSLLCEPRATINKVGHDLHTKIAEFRDVSLSPSIAAACRSLGYIHPLVVQVRSDLTQPVLLTTREKQRILVSQSMAIFKPPKIGGASMHRTWMVHFSTPSLRAALGERLFQVAAWACGARQEVLWCRFWWPLEDCAKENGCLSGCSRISPNACKTAFQAQSRRQWNVLRPSRARGVLH